MALTYKTLAGKPQIFLRLTGVSINNFQEIIKNITDEWEHKITLKLHNFGSISWLGCTLLKECKILAVILGLPFPSA